MNVLSHAKTNLFLKVLRRRQDGFHEIETLISRIALADEIEITPNPNEEFTLSCSDPSVPTNQENLVLRAAETLKEAAPNCLPGLHFHLEKHIPHGAGLGGGSSNAATVLRTLRAAYHLPLDDEQLRHLAAKLGSDIPAFLLDAPSLCRGRGEQISLWPTKLPALPILLLKPSFGVSTPWAYSQWSVSQELPNISYSAQSHQHLPGLNIVNDLERPVFQKYIHLAQLKRWLLGQNEVEVALMSGSGSTMLAIPRQEASIQKLREKCEATWGADLWLQATELLPTASID
ncbi:MAG: 4-(cytidine 5'-diphospho)-2-C-methyl-D-erythritol kinase [Verrucomicrobiales bacterium]